MESIEQFISNLSRCEVPKGSNLELELRFIIDSRKHYDISSKTYHTEQTIDIAKQLIKKYQKNPATIEQTINFIAGEKIKQMNFIRGEQQKDKHTYYSKTRVIEPMFFLHSTLPAYRLNVSYETPIPEFSVKDATLARVRLRYCISLGDWRLDITLVKNVTSFSNPATLKDAKSSLLFNIELDNFLDKAPWKSTDTIEFELEWIGKQASITIDKLSIGNTLFDGILDNDEVGYTTSDTSLQSSNYQALIYQVAKYIKPKQAERFKRDSGMKQLSNQVIELDVNIYMKELHETITDYYITDKLDGTRAVCFLTPEGCHALTSTDIQLPVKTSSVYILDTELYEGKYYIFDVMVYNDEVIFDKPFSERLTYFDKVIEDFKSSKLFTTKPFIKLTDKYQSQIAVFKIVKKPYKVDGIVLTPESGEYDTMRVYKYKPTEHLTVDFLIKKCPDKLLGIKPYMPTKENPNLYLLFCGISKNAYIRLGMRLIRIDELFPGLDYKNLPNYFPVQFQPSDKTFAYIFWSDKPDLDGEVGEFSCVGDKDVPCHWHLHRVREDRKVEVLRGNYFGNNYKVAELVWMSYKTPLVIENIPPANSKAVVKSAGPAASYFQEHDNQLQKASRNFNSFVKATILNQFRTTEWVLDIASGKGQDLFRYGSVGTKNLICLEIDQLALMELIARKHDFSAVKERGAMNIQIHQLDINNDYKENIEILSEINIPNHGVDLIVCNFAFHYFLANKKNLSNVIKFINHYLKPGGRFIFTAFDGKEIIQLLNENSGNWTIKVGDETQYSIKKQYDVSFLDTIGQKIEVLLPFSKNAYYQEYLVNIDYIAGEFASAGMTLEIDQGFGSYLDDYKRVNRKNYETMTPADIRYVSNYHYYCFYKRIPVATGSSSRRK